MSTSDDTTIPVKRCPKCDIDYPATIEYFYADKSVKSGLGTYCRTCQRECSRKNHHANAEQNAARSRQYYAANRERLNEGNKARYAADIEKSRAGSRRRNEQWRTNNRTQYRANQRKYRLAHRQRVRANHQAWYQRNLAHARLASLAGYHRRRAKLLAVGGDFTKEDILFALRTQHGKCWHCGKPVGKYHADHLRPISRGGSNDARNIVISCVPCNLSKGDKETWEWNGRMF